jgi:ABC-2 type transport system ATP-binding protein
MLLGLLNPTRGTSSILDCDSARLTPEIRARIGYLAEGHFIYGWMRVRECAWFQSRSFPRWNQKIFDAVIDHFRLDPGARASALSRGQRAGLCLALTMAPEPEVLILDDPALGLDPVARRALVEALLAVTRRRDRTILISSHLLDDVERIADRLAIFDGGLLKVHCAVEAFRDRITRWILRFDRLPDRLGEIRGLVHCRSIENELHLTVANGDQATESALAKLGAASIARVPIGMESAIIDYLERRAETGSLLEAVGGVS